MCCLGGWCVSSPAGDLETDQWWETCQMPLLRWNSAHHEVMRCYEENVSSEKVAVWLLYCLEYLKRSLIYSSSFSIVVSFQFYCAAWYWSFSFQVVCGSKYIVRGENARDHVDLLVSSRHWPPVYVVDTASSVALCADIYCPDLTSQLWGKNQGCFSDPMDPPAVSDVHLQKPTIKLLYIVYIGRGKCPVAVQLVNFGACSLFCLTALKLLLLLEKRDRKRAASALGLSVGALEWERERAEPTTFVPFRSVTQVAVVLGVQLNGSFILFLIMGSFVLVLPGVCLSPSTSPAPNCWTSTTV